MDLQVKDKNYDKEIETLGETVDNLIYDMADAIIKTEEERMKKLIEGRYIAIIKETRRLQRFMRIANRKR